MKNKILLLLLLVLVFASCSQENAALPQDVDTPKEVTVRIKTKLKDMVTGLPVTIENGTSKSTRAGVTALTTEVENKINNLWVFQYASGSLLKAQRVPSGTNFNDFALTLEPNSNCNIYFVANFGLGLGGCAVGNSTTGAPKLESTFLGLDKNYGTQIYLIKDSEDALAMPMVGALLNANVPSGGSFSTFSVPLKRLLARVDFTYSTGSGVYLNTLRVRNVPNRLRYIPPTNAFPTAVATNFKDFPTETVPSTSPTPTTSTFYLPTNMQGKSDNTDITNKTGEGFPYATYFELVGSNASAISTRLYSFYVGSDAGDYNVEADKYYKIDATIKGTSLTDKRAKLPMSTYSNCYMVAPGSSVTVDPTFLRYINYKYGLPTLPTSYTARILWQTDPSPSYISINQEYLSECFTVTVPNKNAASGNAVVYIESGGTIYWSWHIWITNYNPVTTAKSFNYLNFMDRNLGATLPALAAQTSTVATVGLYYQWGRKDPFSGPATFTDSSTPMTLYKGDGTVYVVPTPTNTAHLNNSVLNPTDFFTTGSSFVNGFMWGSGTNKNIFDPCPVGWRVPSFRNNETISPWNGLSTNNSTWDSAAAGRVVNSNVYPAVGYRAASSFGLIGERAFYWTATKTGVNNPYTLYLFKTEGTVNPMGTDIGLVYALPIRCVQE